MVCECVWLMKQIIIELHRTNETAVACGFFFFVLSIYITNVHCITKKEEKCKWFQSFILPILGFGLLFSFENVEVSAFFFAAFAINSSGALFCCTSNHCSFGVELTFNYGFDFGMLLCYFKVLKAQMRKIEMQIDSIAWIIYMFFAHDPKPKRLENSPLAIDIAQSTFQANIYYCFALVLLPFFTIISNYICRLRYHVCFCFYLEFTTKRECK